ncbi:MAG: hypoxanthine phosphoribosyltransferase [Lachnospiraceae bacterium]|nr:hypoxanthine phosphoribosyltransferase [Lachnospiraceae bacterium]
MKEVLHQVYSTEEVDKVISGIAEQINRDYEGKELHLICILRGSVFFCVDLAKKLTMPVSMDFMAASSYGNEVTSSGQLSITKDLDDEIEGKHCLIIEDIIDSGNTLKKVKELLAARNPESLKICTLLDKPSRREVEVKVDYTGFEIPDKFVVGYGLDYAQKYRNLPYLAEVEFVEN